MYGLNFSGMGKVSLLTGTENGGRWQIRTADLMRVMHAL